MTATAAPSTPKLGKIVTVPAPAGVGELRQIPLADLRESPWNPRKRFDPAKLTDLAESLKNGQLEPLVVRPIFNGTNASRPLTAYEIGAGHRRFRAAPQAGLTSLLAIVREMDDARFLELLNTDNKQRDELDALDEAEGFKVWMEKVGLDVRQIAERIALSEKYVYDRLKLLQLVPAAKKLLQDQVITAGHAILLARLSPTEQKRTIGDEDQISDSWRGASGGLFESEDAEGLGLDDSVKPRSVRELETWIHNHIRAKPERVDPFLFPESAAALEAAREEKLDVIHITRDYRVDDEARDEKTRTFGSQAWKRADGKPEEDFYTGRSVKSKPCDFSRYGFVVAGPGQGEVFKVCVNKKKCATHWPDQVKAEKERAKRASSGKSGTPAKPKRDSYEEQRERDRLERERDEAERARWEKALPALAKALAERVKTAPIGPASALISRVLDTVAPYPHDLWRPAVDLVPVGKTPEQLLRRVAWLTYLENVNKWRVRGMADEFKALGIEAQKIVDEVAPKPKAEKKPAAKKAKKGAR